MFVKQFVFGMLTLKKIYLYYYDFSINMSQKSDLYFDGRINGIYVT